MTGAFKRFLAGVLGGMLAAAAVAPVIAVAETATNVPNEYETWYFNFKEPLSKIPGGDPTCGLPTGCNATVVTAPNPYPQNTLHVGINGGVPEATSAIAFNLTDLPLGAMVTGGKTTLPVLGQEAGTRNQDQAEMVACLTTGLLVSSQDAASFNDRPEFDCSVSSPLEKTSIDGTLAYTVDLAPFGAKWSQGEPNNGISILPTEAAQNSRGTWHVAFPQQRFEGDTPKITSDLTYEAPETTPSDTGTGLDTTGPSTTTSPPFDSGGFDDGGGFGDGGFDTGGGFGDGGDTAFTSPPSFADSSIDSVSPPISDSGAFPETAPVEEEAPVAADEGAVVAEEPSEQAAAEGGVNPVVWYVLVALLGLGTAGLLAYALSQPVELPATREGAVSKLMRRRRGAGLAAAS